MKRIVITSGYFNPIHKGHLAYLEAAQHLGDLHIVIINNDEQVIAKGSTPFMTQFERARIVESLNCVGFTVISIDSDKTVVKTLDYLGEVLASSHQLVFANGGDRTPNTIEEFDVCNKHGIKLAFEVGGNEKLQSSSTLIKDAQNA